MAYEKVSIGNITTAHRKIGVANISNPMGDGVNNGLLGLAYSSLSSALPAKHSSNEDIPANYISGKKVRSYWATTDSSVTYGSSEIGLPIRNRGKHSSTRVITSPLYRL